MDDDRRLPLVDRLLHDGDLALSDRVAGCLVLLYAQQLSRIVALSVDDVITEGDVQLAARHADPRTTTVYDYRRQGLDRHAAYIVVAFVSGG
ncbi:MAG: hypothetical protein M0Z40_16970 [Actinomycetota bacterium]|nr:hypothetical protein [Actinomycetota bacterium]